eukprot:CAMPEP_0197514760 /NCGR_PEP_ID=MMETSP1318-20131121/106_1 /TAXON_ID=552666 /ORGANISM="Partenskyella glossopodia, Strain RCC365" /LENGTH=337 /DNA_ID=CAMNT_0043062945 /DNA_START=74 /DNA_END=1087 /DNA_ORIENTATION=+
MAESKKTPIRVLISGAAGQIGYSLIPMIASGRALGPDQPISLVLLDIPPCATKLQGVCMEVLDCSFGLLTEVIPSTDAKTAFKGVNLAILVGGFPRKKGMVRADLLKINGGIFSGMGKAIADQAHPNVKVVVVANPANTNCLIAALNADKIPKKNFSALTRLDMNRAKGQVMDKLALATSNDVKNIVIWGNHSKTQYPDVTSAQVKKGSSDWTPIAKVASEEDMKFFTGEFITTVQYRGAAVIKARGLSSACSAANAVGDHIKSLYGGTSEGEIVSMAVWSNGNPYGIADGLYYSFPVTCKGGEWEFAKVPTTAEGQKLMKATEAELLEEKKEALAK